MIAPSHRLIAVCFLAAAALLPARAEEYALSEKFDRTHAFKSDGEITFSNTNGEVKIQTWDRAEIRIEGEKRAKTEEELKLIAVNIDVTDARLRIKTEFPKRSSGFLFGGNHVRGHVKFTLTVPASVKLRDIGTVNGSIAIEGVRGPVRAHSVNGRLSAAGLAGDTSLETVNGSIKAEFAAVVRDQRISTKTVNGSATIGLPSDASLTFSARSVNGSINCDFPLQLADKSRNRLKGTIGDGAASLESQTVNGSIRVTKL